LCFGILAFLCTLCLHSWPQPDVVTRYTALGTLVELEQTEPIVYRALSELRDEDLTWSFTFNAPGTYLIEAWQRRHRATDLAGEQYRVTVSSEQAPWTETHRVKYQHYRVEIYRFSDGEDVHRGTIYPRYKAQN